ncbi:MAG: DsbA family protein, partial [Lutimaribacter sp.]
MKRRSVILGAAALVLASAAGFFTYGNSSSKLPPMGMLNAQSAADVDTSSVLEMSMGAPDAPLLLQHAQVAPH